MADTDTHAERATYPASFPPRGTAVVVGAGGIGSALVRQLQDDDRFARIIVGTRSTRSVDVRRLADRDPDRTGIAAVDLHEETSIAKLAETVERAGPALRLVVCATGILHRGDHLKPERRLEDVSPDNFAEAFAINASGPMLVAKHLAPRLPRRGRSVFAAISARVGSIGDNRLGGWYAYRASKAALNQLLKSVAIETARRAPEAVIAALHPGTVDTTLSSPFHGCVPEGQLFSPEYSAGCLLQVIDGLTPADSGGFFAWDGSPIPW